MIQNLPPSSRYKFWNILRQINDDLNLSENTLYKNNLNLYLKEQCGIRLIYDPNGNIFGEFDIIDEAKYVFFLLKYQLT